MTKRTFFLTMMVCILVVPASVLPAQAIGEPVLPDVASADEPPPLPSGMPGQSGGGSGLPALPGLSDLEVDLEPLPGLDTLNQEVASADARAAAIRKALDKVDEARALWQRGDLDGAIALVEEALRLDAESEEARGELLSMTEGRKNFQAARALREEGRALLSRDMAAEAVVKFRESLGLWKDDETSALLEQGVKRQTYLGEMRETASRLLREALADEGAGKFDDALLKLRESLRAVSLPEAREAAGRIEALVRERDERKAKADDLKTRAQALEKDGRLEEALDLFEESLRYVQDKAVNETAARLHATIDARLATDEQKKTRAAALARKGAELERIGSLEEALASYEASIALWQDAKAEEAAGRLAAAIREKARIEGEKKERAYRLFQEGYDLELTDHTEEALAKYRESRLTWPDKEAEDAVRRLQAQLSERRDRKAKATGMAAKASELEQSGKVEDALDEYLASQALWPDPQIAKAVDRLRVVIRERIQSKEEKQLRAGRLFRSGSELERAGDLDGARERFAESLALLPDPKVEEAMTRLEGKIVERGRSEADARAKALSLFTEASDLELRGELEAARVKLRESQSVVPLRDAEEAIRRIGEKIRAADERKARAAGLSRNGARLERLGRLPEALAAYEESASLVTAAEVDESILRVQGKVDALARESAEKKERAVKLAQESAELESLGRLDEAFTAMRESRTLDPTKEKDEAFARLNARLLERKASEDRGNELYTKAEILEKAGRLEDALAGYETSRSVYRSDRVLEALARVQSAILDRARTGEERRALAAARAARGTALEGQGQLDEALAEFNASAELSPDIGTDAAVARLRGAIGERDRMRADARADAGRLLEDALRLERAGKLDEALAKARESASKASDSRSDTAIERIEKALAEREAVIAGARALFREALDLEVGGKLQDALSKLRQSNRTWETAETSEAVERVTKAIREREEKQELALKSYLEGGKLEASGRLEEALAKFEESLGFFRDKDAYDAVTRVNRKIVDAAKKREAARQIATEAEELRKIGDLEGAFAKYQESYALFPDKELGSELAKIAAEAKLDRDRRARAEKLADEGHSLLKEGREREAFERFTESLALRSDSVLEKRTKALGEKVRADEERLARARGLRSEGIALQKQGNPEEALKKYRESLGVRPDPELQAYADQLETLLLSEKERREKAAAFRAEGIALQKNGRNAEALEKYRQSLSYRKDPQLETHVKKLYEKIQRDMREAVRLRNEGVALQKTGRLKDALRIYKLSLSLYPMPDLEAHVKGIERKIAEQAERTKLAALLYNEATVLRKQGKIEAALEKYRRSVELVPNKRAEDIIKALEKDVVKLNERREREEALRKGKQGSGK
jgi:tetratricopeptide (TPR) repeat protein